MTDSTLLAPLGLDPPAAAGRDRPPGQRLRCRPRHRDRPADRERAPAHPRRRRRTAARRAQRPRQHADRGGHGARPPRRPGAADAPRGRRRAAPPLRARGRHDPHRRLDNARRLPASRHARLLPPRPPERHRRGRDRLNGRDPRPAARRPACNSLSSARPTPTSASSSSRSSATRSSASPSPACSPSAVDARTRRSSHGRRCSSASRARARVGSANARSRAHTSGPSAPGSSTRARRSSAPRARDSAIAFLSRYAVAEEIERGELEAFRIGKPHRAQPPRRPARPTTALARASAASSRPSPAAARRTSRMRLPASARCTAPSSSSPAARPKHSSDRGAGGWWPGRASARQWRGRSIVSLPRRRRESAFPHAAHDQD